MPRRSPGTLLALEREILRAGLAFTDAGDRFHGFGLAAALRGDHRGLIAHGTLYKALARLQVAGMLAAVWEAPEDAERDGRPRRKLYEVTPAGASALRAAERPETSTFRAVHGGAS